MITIAARAEDPARPARPRPSLRIERARRPEPATLARWQAELSDQDPQAIVRFALDKFGSELAVATQFGLEGCTLLHRVAEEAIHPFFFTIDTGLLFSDTLRLAERLEDKLGITIHRIEPEFSVEKQAEQYGARLWDRDPDQCCALRKVAPMHTALRGRRAWMTAIRREQSAARSQTQVVDWDPRFQVVKFAPLAMQSAEEIERYAKTHAVPTNPLRLLGYSSIGCTPCTQPNEDSTDLRAGRWTGSSKTECGLHLAPT